MDIKGANIKIVVCLKQIILIQFFKIKPSGNFNFIINMKNINLKRKIDINLS